MKNFWMSMLCILALALSIGFVGCSKDNDKGNSHSQTYEDEYTKNY